MIPINYTNTDLLNIEKPVLLSFWAPWCSACKSQQNTLQKAEHKLTNYQFASIDISENRVLAQRYSVANIPSLLLLQGGEITKRLHNISSIDHLTHQLKNN